MKKAFYSDDIKVAVIGGGTGSFTLLGALKQRTDAIAALVNMADDGGSTGVLRDELGVLPPGDVRQCLVALSNSPELRDLFNYRFEEGSLGGHAFGNLFLAALEGMTGDFARSVELASEVLNITGVVEPITLSSTTLVMDKPDGTEVRGEYRIAHLNFEGQRPSLRLDPAGEANLSAIKAIDRADVVIVAPGNLYGSLAPALLVPGVGDALKRTSARCVYVANLVTKPGQTDGYDVCTFADEIERFTGTKFLDAVIYNTEMPSKRLLKRYAEEGELAVRLDSARAQTANYDLLGAPLLSRDITFRRSRSDPLASRRTLIRHDASAVADVVWEYLHRIDR